MNKIAKLLFGIIISIIFLWLAFQKGNISEVTKIIRKADIFMLLLSILFTVIGLILRSYRWKLIGRDYEGIKWLKFFKATSMGLMLNVFLPFRSGDLFQGYFLSKKGSISKSYVFSTVFVERLMDFLPPLLLIISGSFFIILPEQIRINKLLLIVTFLIACLFAVILFRNKFIGIINRFSKFKHGDKIERLLNNIIEAIAFLKNKQVIFVAIPLTFFNWIVIYPTSYLLMMKSINININYWSVLLVMSISVLSAAIPSSPGFIGTWEFFTVIALGIFNVERNRALSYAVLSHFMTFLPFVIIGLFYFFYEISSSNLLFKESQKLNNQS